VTTIDDAIKVGELVLATAEGLIDAISAAKRSLEDSAAQLKQSITEAKKKQRDDLAADRKATDNELDKKFDHKDDP
jgi:hypothetical protein